MRLKSTILMIAAAGIVASRAVPANAAEVVQRVANDNLLLRVQFAGMTALTANTNAAYLTRFIGLPESTALGTQIVARAASLPTKLFNPNATNEHSDSLQPVFAEMFRQGFTLELRGTQGAVTDFAVAAKADADTLKRWESAWDYAATNSSRSSNYVAKHSGDELFIAGSKGDPTAALAAIQKTTGTKLDGNTIMQGELASSLIAGPVQRSVYGSFDRLKLTVTAADQTLKINGTATYAQDLPKLGPPPVVPTNLVTEPAISFTLVREPSAWLEPTSALRRLLPNPMPETAFFWGCETSPYQMFMAIPFPEPASFNTGFGSLLLKELAPLAKFIDSGDVALETNPASIVWPQVPFVIPRATLKKTGTNDFLMAELFPSEDPTNSVAGLTPALVERVSGHSQLMLFDWEFTQARLGTWLRVGQLAIFLSGHQQLRGDTASWKWILVAQKQLESGGSTFTEITQTGPRELTLKRSAPLAFTSIELFWLANWLESPNFPAANFLVPANQQ